MHHHLGDAFLDAAKTHRGKPCLTEGDRNWLYEEIGGMASVASRFIAAREPGEGKPIGMLIPNSSLFAVHFFGALIVDRVAMPINPLLKGDEIAAQIVHSGARLVLTVEPFRGLMDQALAALGSGYDVEVVYCDSLKWPSSKDLDLILEETCSGRKPHPESAWDALAILLYTSGSTGDPKGVMLSHGNILSNVRATYSAMGVFEDDVFLAVLPYFHIFGLTCCLAVPMLCGNRFVVLPRFGVDETVRAIRNGRVTMLLMVPTMYSLISKSRRACREDFVSARYAVSGGSPLSASVGEAFSSRYGVPIGEGYGATEVSPVVSMSNAHSIRVGSVGPLVPGVQVRVVGRDWKPLPAGTRGRILVRGPNVMKGYWRRPDLTAEVLDEEGWYDTRDMGMLDSDGYLSIAGRADNMILVGAENIYPIDIERVIAEHPAVAEVAVAGISHEMRGQVIEAFVRPREEATVSTADLRLHCTRRLSPIKVPGRFHIVTDFPRTPTGKIQKYRLAGNYDSYLIEEEAE